VLMRRVIIIFLYLNSMSLIAKEKVSSAGICTETFLLSNFLENFKKEIFSFEDQNGDLTNESLLKKEIKWNKVSLPQQLGFTESNHWVCLNLLNDTNNEFYYLENTVPYVDHVELFQYIEDRLINQALDGDKYPLRISPFSHYPNPLFELHIPKSKVTKLLIKYKSDSSLFIDPIILSENELHHRIVSSYGRYYGFFGIIIIILFLNIVLFIRTRNTSFFYYAVYVVFTGFYQFAYSGLAKVYLWPNFGFWNNHSLVFFGSLAFIGVILFSIRFLGIRKRTKFIFPILSVLFSFILLNAITSLFFSLQRSDINAHILGGITSFLLLGTGIYIWKKGLKIARFYILAWIALLISIVLFDLFALGYLPDSPLARFSVHIGTMIEMFLFNFAIIDRLQELNETKLNKLYNDDIDKFSNSNYVQKKTTRLLNLNREEVLGKMKLLFDVEKIYCDEDLSLGRLAEMLEIRPDQLSELINEELKTNFSAHINHYRIEEAKNLLLSEPDRSVLSIAFAVGFNTKSSFYESFQKFTDMNPKSYRKLTPNKSSDS